MPLTPTQYGELLDKTIEILRKKLNLINYQQLKSNVNKQVEQKIRELLDEVVKTYPENTVKFQLTITSEGAAIDYETRSLESLKRDGMSMRSLRGDFIS